MLLVKYIRSFSKILVKALQTQVVIDRQKRKRASCFASCDGSATVETVLVFPIFLCAICMLIVAGQLMLTEARIQYAVSKTADIFAAQKAVRQIGEQQNKQKTDSLVGVSVIFASVYADEKMDKNCIQGGRAGIVVRGMTSPEEEEIVRVQANYRLKVDVPFFRPIYFRKSATVQQRIFSGYTEKRGRQNPEKENSGLVYVTDHGQVYHTSLSCSHICLKISGGGIRKIIEGGKYKACEKCIQKGKIPGNLYITKYGNKYHSSLGCSGLKRTVKVVRKEEAKGMRPCSRCGGHK